MDNLNYNLDSTTLHCFLAVAETGSFTKAAERVGRTQSAVSQQMAKLESLLGKPLFHRGKALTPTPEGEMFLTYARQILFLMQEAFERFQEPEMVGEVRFGMPEDFASVFLSDLLVEFTRVHPRISVTIECDLTRSLFERFRRKEFDLVLVKMNRPSEFPNGLDVWSGNLEWVNDGSPLDLSKPLPLVLSPEPCVYREAALRALEVQGMPFRLVFSSPSYAGTVAAVKAGIGITVLPRTMVPARLSIVNSGKLPTLAGIQVSFLKHQVDNTAVNTLESFVLKKLK